MNDDLLERLQADVFSLLGLVPGLSLAYLLAEKDQDLSDEVERGLQTLCGPQSKNGLAIVVFAPEVIVSQKNLPGPVMELELAVQVIELVMVNRDAANGTRLSASRAALRVAQALHLAHLGNVALYTDKEPVKKLKMKDGFVSYMVSVKVFNAGLVPVVKPLGVHAEMLAAGGVEKFLVTGDLTDGSNPVVFPDLLEAGEFDGAIRWTSDGNVAPPSFGDWYLLAVPLTGSGTTLQKFTDAILIATWETDALFDFPFADVEWTGINGSTGIPVVTKVSGDSELALTCASPGAVIRYTTDGSFPTPEKSLYAAPIPGLETGTMVRAAAYLADMPPGDVLDLKITD